MNKGSMHSAYIKLNTNPQPIEVHTWPSFNTAKLVEYSISGVPVTGGTPNDLYFTINATPRIGLHTNFWEGAGPSIMLTNSFTHKELESPVLLWSNFKPTNRMDLVAIRILKPDNTLAVFDEGFLRVVFS